jgi:hypothetical protein
MFLFPFGGEHGAFTSVKAPRHFLYCLICMSSCSIWSAVVMMRVAAE